MIQYYDNETPKFICTLTDGATDQYPQAKVYNYDLTLKETVNLSHNAGGQYAGTASSSYIKGNYSVVYTVYSDSGHTTANTDYWIGEDILDVIYTPYGGYSGGGGSVEIDWKKVVEMIWEHKTPKKILELIEKVKVIVTKITDIKVLKAIKDIKFPEFPKIEFPKIPEPVDLMPLMSKLDMAINEIKNIEIPELPQMPKVEDYGTTISKIVGLLEEIKKSDQSLEIYNILEELKSNKNILKNLEEIKKLIQKYGKVK
jgi:hypothetical protein